jgi:hybrid cluster-associated redox disulfide protein
MQTRLAFICLLKRRLNAMVVTKNTLIGDILDFDQTTASFFFEMGMHCLGCPSSRGETIEQACEVHGVSANILIERINAHLAKS